MRTKLLFLMAMAMVPGFLSATILTVSNNVNHPGQYTTLQSAHDAATSGDTIQWFSTSTNSLTASKKITLIGPGYTSLGSSGPSINFLAGANESRILSGTYNSISLQNGASADLRNCSSYYLYVNGTANLLAEQCIFSNVTYQSSNASKLFNNCIFGFYSGASSFNYNSGSGSTLIDHCVFATLYNFTGGSTEQMVISNSIFTVAFSSGCFNETTAIDKCMFVGFSIDNTYCGTPAVANNNFMNAASPFVAGNVLSNIAGLNYDVIAGSAADNGGNDGTDLGVHGGNNPWPLSYQYGLYPPGMPVVNSFILQNYVIGQGDQIQFNATGTIPSNE